MSELKMVKIGREAPVTEYLHRKALLMRLPLNGTFELTPLCNMDCKMCYVHITKEEQERRGRLHTAEEWIALGERAKEQGMVYLLLTGGEPFLRPDFREIYTALHKMGFILTINTNGTMINEKVMEWLSKMPPIRINITLYGASNETYAKLCGNPRGFDQATHAIKLLRDAGIKLRINCSITPYNVQDLPKIVEFVQKEELHFAPSTYMFPPLRKDGSMVGVNDRFTPEEAAYWQAYVEMLQIGEDNFLKHMENMDFVGLPVDLEDDCTESEGDGIRCRAGKCSFWITWRGEMMPCGMLKPAENVNVFEDDFMTCWQKVVDFANSVRLPAKCKTCPIADSCKSCAAMVYTETGSFDKAPEYRCQMALAYPKACLKLCRELREKRGLQK